MSILIKDMETPKPKLADMATVYHAYVLVSQNGRAVIVVDNEDGLDSTAYPLVPVPAHGDLIERKAIYLTDFEIAMCDSNYKEGMKMLLEKIESAPTIIPASKEGE